MVDLLTRRELEVALLVSEGEGNKQIADRLKLSEWTVSTYLRRIYAKLGVRSRAAMVARIIAHAR
jgi:DNA-binding CsgD family transcriptional regulator